MKIKRHLQLCLRAGCGLPALLAVLIVGIVQPNFAADTTVPGFDSPEQATAALYAAVRNDDRDSIVRLIGPLASSDDIAQDKADRDQFVKKYSEMHRLVKQPDGTTSLYIGAENWPFPVPLNLDHGKWRFDVDAGAQEVVFRRIGENETTAIDTCRAIAQAQAAGKSDPAIRASGPIHGYNFRLIHSPAGTAVVAYPAQYGSTGVMTFAATPDGKVYEKDLGAKTAARAQTITQYKPDRTWNGTEQ